MSERDPSPLVIRQNPPVCYKKSCTWGEGELRFQPLLVQRIKGGPRCLKDELWACPRCGDLYGPYDYMEKHYGNT